MSLDLAAIVRRLQEVEMQHPDTISALDPIIKALSSSQENTIGLEQAGKLLGIQSVATIQRWIELGILAGRWDERQGQWQVPLEDVLRLHASQHALAGAGGEDLSAEELGTLSSTRAGAFPWQRGARP